MRVLQICWHIAEEQAQMIDLHREVRGLTGVINQKELYTVKYTQEQFQKGIVGDANRDVRESRPSAT